MVITIFATNQVCYNTGVYTLIREHFRETEQFMWFGVLVNMLLKHKDFKV